MRNKAQIQHNKNTGKTFRVAVSQVSNKHYILVHLVNKSSWQI